MISKRVNSRRDGRSSVLDALRYGEGLKIDKETGKSLDKSHRTRFGNFGLVDDGVYVDLGLAEMEKIVGRAALEMQANCDLNTRVGADKKLAHIVVSFNQERPSEAVLRDTEDSMVAAMDLQGNHFASFLHNDNGYWHLHLFVSRIAQDELHRGNPLWKDRTKRDQVCREIEARHGLQPDNGMHVINDAGQLVEVPRVERRGRQEAKRAAISDRARTTEIHRGEKSFQTWATEIRLGDRLKHARSWAELHHAAAAYQCEVKPKGAGFIVQPVGQTGGIQLSKLGLKNLPARLGAFQEARTAGQEAALASYRPAPVLSEGKEHFEAYTAAKGAFKAIKTERMNVQREAHAAVRLRTRAEHKAELVQIRRQTAGPEMLASVSVAKMQHAVALANLTKEFAEQRQVLRTELANTSPGNTFREYLVREAGKGDNVALGLARRHGVRETTRVLCQEEAIRLRIVAEIGGHEFRPAPRLRFAFLIEPSGTVTYFFGAGRVVTDSAIARRVQLNDVAATSPDTISAALRLGAAKFGSPLALTGPEEFQRLAVETAVRDRLPVRFADPVLEAYRAELEAQRRPAARGLVAIEFSHLTNRQIFLGVTHVLNNNLDRGTPPPEHILRAQQDRSETAAGGAGGLQNLPNGSMDGPGDRAAVLLPSDVPGGVASHEEQQGHDVRRPGAGGTGSGEGDGQAEPGRVPVNDQADQERAALVAELRGQGVEVREIIDGKKYPGLVHLVSDQFVVQHVARGAVVLHERGKISGQYVVGQDAHIEYVNGIGHDKNQHANAAQKGKPGTER